MKKSRLFISTSTFTLALACAVGFGIASEIAFAQTPAGQRRGGTSSGGSTSETSGSSTSYGVEERGYLPYELDKPIEEFFLGQTAYTQPAGGLQVTLGGGLDFSSGGMQVNGLLARGEYGITNNFEVHAALPVTLSQKPDATTGQTQSSIDPSFERVELGVMYAITPMNNPIALSAAVDVDIPLAAATSDQVVIKPSIIGAYDFGATEFHSDLQAELGGAARGLNFNAGIAHSLGEFVPTLELNTQATEGQAPVVHATPGLYYNFSNRMEFGVGVPIGLNDVSETGVVAKLNIAFGRQ